MHELRNQDTSLSLLEAFALCHFLPTRCPADTLRIAADTPRQVRKGRTDARFSERRENIRSLRRCAANPG